MNLRNKVLAYTAVAGLGLALVGCQPAPGPISVDETVTPSTISSGGYASVKIKVTNMGGKVTLDSATLYEEVMNGIYTGQNATADIPLSVSEVPAYGAAVIFSKTIPVRNITGYDVTLEDTVTVNSDGGTATDVTDYTILHQ